PRPPEEAPAAPVPGGPGDCAHTALRPGRTRPPAPPVPERSRRSRRVLLTALGVVLVLGGATGVMFLRHGSDGGVAAGAVTGTRASGPATSSARPTAAGTSARTSPRPGRPATGPTTGGGTGPAPLPGANPPPATTAAASTAANPPPAPPHPTSGGPAETIAPAPPSRCTTGGCAGRAYFVATGEHLFVCDENSDGYGAIARYTRTDVPGQNNVAADGNGAGTCVDHNMNMPEGSHITFSICLIDKAGKTSRCSASITATA
ncbi:MAG TPA: hypothetical protein VFX70_00350, partial [Mycobacteriales bacterium]|nr:hypothetical protein [Mycobacteriales bacterium]